MVKKNRVGRGRLAETLARKHLKKQGLKITETNFRWRGGEIDIIAKDKDIIVFIEVRSLAQDVGINPILTIDPVKREKIRRTALYYLSKEGLIDKRDCRFDVVGVLFKEGGPEIIHLKNAFSF